MSRIEILHIWIATLAAWIIVVPTVKAEVTLQVEPVDSRQIQDLDFGDAQSLGPQGESESGTVVRRVKLSISSSSSGRYQVLQRINSSWANLANKEFPIDSVLFSVSESPSKGDVRFPNPSPLTFADQEIYLSDSSGSDTELLITYTVRVPVGQQSGRYRTTVSYQVASQ